MGKNMASAHIPLGYHAMNSEANSFVSEDDRLVRACHQSSRTEPEACGREPRRRAMTRRYALRDGFGDFQVAHLRQQSLEPQRCMATDLRSPGAAGRQRVRNDRLDHRASAPAQCWGRKGRRKPSDAATAG